MNAPAPVCRQCREAIRLKVAGLLPEKQASAWKEHLAECTDCQNYERSLRAATEGLRRLASKPVTPGAAFHARWTSAVRQPEPAAWRSVGAAHRFRAAGATLQNHPLIAWSRRMLWQNRRVLAALAPVWILSILFRLSAPEVGHPDPTTVARSPIEVFLALGNREMTLIESSRQRHQASPAKPPASPPQSGRTPARQAMSGREPRLS